MLENQDFDDILGGLDEQAGRNKPMDAILIWAAILLVILGVIFLFLPLQTQIVIQRLKDKKYILGEKK